MKATQRGRERKRKGKGGKVIKKRREQREKKFKKRIQVSRRRQEWGNLRRPHRSIPFDNQ
jgi:hypothetical protein